MNFLEDVGVLWSLDTISVFFPFGASGARGHRDTHSLVYLFFVMDVQM